MMWEVQHWTVCDGWLNTWSISDESGKTEPQYFDTYEEALHELSEFFADTREMIESEGESWDEYGYDPDDFRIVYIEGEMVA